MERRIRPIPHALDVAVLDRIEMNVIDMPREIAFIAERVLPIAPLPQAALAFAGTARRNTFVGRQVMREDCFDEAPSQCKIGIVLRQRPDGMHVVGENDDRFDVERMTPPHIPERLAQQIDVRREQAQLALGQIHREEEAASGEEIAPVIAHVRSIAKPPRGWILLLQPIADPRGSMMGIASLHPSLY